MTVRVGSGAAGPLRQTLDQRAFQAFLEVLAAGSERDQDGVLRPQEVKEGRPGEVRPLGISNFEDKVVQMMTAKILGAIYEPTFRECSYGFRPGRGCHTAIKALGAFLHRHDCEVVIDIDLRNYFGTIDHEILVEMLRQRIRDETFIRYIVRMLKAGILSDGELQMTEEGSPQGNVASPILSNIYGHFVIDSWFEDVVKSHCIGRVELFRYCDDMVICCQLRTDADRIFKALEGRLAKAALSLNLDKTRLVSFDRKAFCRGEQQDSFDFLGFIVPRAKEAVMSG